MTRIGDRKRRSNSTTIKYCILTILILYCLSFLLTLQRFAKLVDGSSGISHRVDGFITSATDTISSSLSNTGESPTSPPYAYLWILGGIDEHFPAYKGFLWDIIISAKLLRKLGSTQDFWLYYRLSPNSDLDRLPDDDMLLLSAMGIHVKQLETPSYESFGQLVFDKFLSYNMTDYKRVMFLDADILPLVNLDLFFHLSDPEYTELPTVLKPNFIIASRSEPCNTGMFIVEPSELAFKQYAITVQEQAERAKTLPYPHFSNEVGWGYNFKKNNDYWEAVIKKGQNWKHWHASHSDQGLMLYLAKYVRKDTSIAIGDRLQNWRAVDGQEKPELEEETKGLLATFQPEPLVAIFDCDKALADVPEDEIKHHYKCTPPYNSHVHFIGGTKPWRGRFNPKTGFNITRAYKRFAANSLWFRELEELNKEFGMGLDISNWNKLYLPTMKNDTIGTMAMYKDQKIYLDGADEKKKSNEGDTAILETTNSGTSGDKPVVIAYAISLIKCGDHQNNAAGLIDASLVLRHSIHKISSRNPKSGSKYDYKMYAFVHTQAKQCAEALEKTGFEVKVVDPPLKREEIKGEYLRTHIQRERCCGHDEFIKLYAYSLLPEEIIVHVDADFALYKPMDHLYDAILYDKDSKEGKAARNLIELEFPTEKSKLPDKIGAFLTRDWTQVIPGKFPPGYQAGFLVARRDPSIMNEMVKVIKEGNYSYGWGHSYGWGNKGYGGYVGAMAMQGLVAYYYDHIRPDNAVELNQCKFNHMGVDVFHKGKCRNGLDNCEDCMKTSMTDVYSMHYTMCRKPWLCQATGAPGGKKKGGGRGSALNTNSVNVDHCLEMAREWHVLRSDFETSLYGLTKDESIHEGATGTYKKDYFLGHCKGDGDSEYLPISGDSTSMARIQELYH